jgi:hypothetical protein
MQGICKLCGQQKELRYGHIVPAFAVRWLKQTSLTGYLKTFKSKVRVQETKRVYLLCADCEQIVVDAWSMSRESKKEYDLDSEVARIHSTFAHKMWPPRATNRN